MTLPVVEQSPRDPDFVADPYRFYDRARTAGPIVFWRDYDAPVTTTFAAADALLRDRRFGREGVADDQIPPGTAPFYAVDRRSMLDQEPPHHTVLRASVLRAFTPRRIEALEPDLRRLARSLAADLPPEVDLITTFAEQFPATVIARLLGVPDVRVPDLLRWSHDMVAMYQARRDATVERAAVAATEAFSDCLRDLIAERRAAPGEDLLSAMTAAFDARDGLTEDDLIANAILLLNAGHEATVHTIGNTLAALLARGQRLGLTMTGLDTFSLVEESLRFDPPLHLFWRTCREPAEIAGWHARPGDNVGILLGAAGRDPANVPEPHRFDPTRSDAPHVAFGAGIHFCLGAPLARLELRIALETLADVAPDLRLLKAPIHADRYHFRAVERLMVRL